MEKRKRRLKSRVRLLVTARHPEDVLNFCAKNHVTFYEVCLAREEVLSLWVTPSGARYLKDYAPSWMAVELCEEHGAVRVKKGLLRHKRLAVLLAVFMLLSWCSSLFIWQVEVHGNEEVSTYRILKALEIYGVREGAFRLGVDQQRVTNGVLREVTELSWLTVNTRGSRLVVLVREENPPPEMVGDEPQEIVAARSGVIERVTALEGFACVSPGDAVEAGEVLIASAAESQFRGTRYLPAMGEVLARTEREITLCVPMELEMKQYTGEKNVRYALIFGSNRLNCYFNSRNPYTECDKISVEYPLRLPGAGPLPFSLLQETFREYETAVFTDREEAEALLRDAARRRLSESLPRGGEILREEYITEEIGGALFVTLRAECLEDIALARTTDAAEMIPEE